MVPVVDLNAFIVFFRGRCNTDGSAAVAATLLLLLLPLCWVTVRSPPAFQLNVI